MPSDHSHMTGEPAVSHDRGQDVLARGNERGHVVDLVLSPGRVVGPSRPERRIRDADAVDVGDIDAMGGGVQPRSNQAAPSREGAAEQRRTGRGGEGREGGGASAGGGRVRPNRGAPSGPPGRRPGAPPPPAAGGGPGPTLAPPRPTPAPASRRPAETEAGVPRTRCAPGAGSRP